MRAAAKGRLTSSSGHVGKHEGGEESGHVDQAAEVVWQFIGFWNPVIHLNTMRWGCARRAIEALDRAGDGEHAPRGGSRERSSRYHQRVRRRRRDGGRRRRLRPWRAQSRRSPRHDGTGNHGGPCAGRGGDQANEEVAYKPVSGLTWAISANAIASGTRARATVMPLKKSVLSASVFGQVNLRGRARAAVRQQAAPGSAVSQ